MQIDIKCMECSKMTRYVELGQIYYDIDNISESVAVKESIICPKCKKDISQGKCLVKQNYFLMSLLVANISLIGEAKKEFSVPQHLQGSIPLKKQQYQSIARHCKAIVKLVEKF